MREMGKEKDIGEATYKKELTMVIDVEGPEKVNYQPFKDDTHAVRRNSRM